jgi:hypothetical protein
MSLAGIEDAVNALSPDELAELSAFIRDRENRAWDQQIDTDFSEGGRLRAVAGEVRDDIRAGGLEDLP